MYVYMCLCVCSYDQNKNNLLKNNMKFVKKIHFDKFRSISAVSTLNQKKKKMHMSSKKFHANKSYYILYENKKNNSRVSLKKKKKMGLNSNIVNKNNLRKYFEK